MTKTALENKKLEVTEAIERRKDKTNRRGQNLQFIGSAARMAGPLMGALAHVQDKKYFLNLNPVATSSIADIPSFINGGINIVNAKGAQYITDYLVGYTYFLPTIGMQFSKLQESDINTGFFRLQALLKSMNSRFSSYEAGDLGQLLYAGMETACAIANAKRVLSCAVHTDPCHIDLAKRFIVALGFNYADVTSHWKDYAARLNVLIDKANAILRLPADWSLLNHRLAYNSYVHRDRTQGVVAYHLLCQYIYGHYEEDSASVIYENGSDISAGDNANFEDLLDVISVGINSLESTSLINDFTSDMDNAATRGLKLYIIDYFDVHNPKVLFSDDPGIGDTIRNSIIDSDLICDSSDVPVSLNVDMLDIKQSVDGYLYQGVLPDPDNISASTMVMGWGTVNAWYNTTGGAPLFIPYNVVQATDFTGATYNHTYGTAYPSTLDVDDINTDMGGLLESIRLQAHVSTVELFTRLAASPSTTGKVSLPHCDVIGTELGIFHGIITKFGSYYLTYCNYNDRIGDLGPASIYGTYAYGYAPIIANGNYSVLNEWNASVHKLVYVPKDNLSNMMRLGTLSLYYIDAPLKLGGTR